MSPLRADPSRIAAVRRYLETQFPQHSIHDRHEADTITEIFSIENTATNHVYRIKVSREFLDDNLPDAIAQKLEHWKVAEVVALSGAAVVLVTSTGPREQGA